MRLCGGLPSQLRASPCRTGTCRRQSRLVVEELAGDYDLGPLEAGAERVVLIARRP